MQWKPDEEEVESYLGGCSRFSGIPDTPAQLIADDYFRDPFVQQEIRGMVDEWELMGYDLEDPELMGAFLKNIIGKIKKRIQARRAKRKGKAPSVSVKTDSGTASIGPSGLTWTSPTTTGKVSSSGTQVTTGSAVPAATGGITDMLKNPMVLGALVGVPILLMMMKGKKS